MKVCIIQPVMKGYRVPFFLSLNERLARGGIELQVVYGTPSAEEAMRGDNVQLPPPLGREVNSHCIFRKLLVMPTVRPWLSADLVIVEHANKHVLNYILSGLRTLGVKHLAYWGHGRNRQGNPNTTAERYKRRSLHCTDWWFAYTSGTAEYLAEQGFDRRRITIVENAIDTRALRAEFGSVTKSEREQALAALGWKSRDRVAVYCGSLYANKRLELLLDACEKVHAKRADFRLLVIGGGTHAECVTQFARDRDWIHYAGPQFGRKKAVLLSLAEMWLNPGAVGLGILDAFASGLPFLTTIAPDHSPEIEYLVDGDNGLLLAPDADGFAVGIAKLIEDQSLLVRMREEAQAAGRRYSIDAMVENFACGLEQCLTQF